MSVMLILYIAIFAAALLALMARSRLANHLLLGLAGAFGLAYGFHMHGLLGVLLPGLILIVASVQAGSVLVANNAARFTPQEEEMMSGPLAGLGRAQTRRLLDQGFWMDGRPGDVLTREGEQAAQLVYLARGAADVHAHGHLVGKIAAGQLIGEATVLGNAPATATIMRNGSTMRVSWTVSAILPGTLAYSPAKTAILCPGERFDHALHVSSGVAVLPIR